MLKQVAQKDFTFPKKQRLTHKKRIAELFTVGNSLKAFPFRVKYAVNGLGFHRVLVSVPKRNIALASQRNHIKRLMREAFRLHQHQLQTHPHYMDIIWVYHGKDKPTYAQVATQLSKLFLMIMKKENTNNQRYNS